MGTESKTITKKLRTLMQETGYPLVQYRDHRKFGPPPNWIGPHPLKKNVIFIGNLPLSVYEDELFSIFSRIGKIYEIYLMNFCGRNRGYAFIRFYKPNAVYKAMKYRNGYQIRPAHRIVVAIHGPLPALSRLEEQNVEFTKELRDLMEETGYPLVQYKGRRIFGPPPIWHGSAPLRECEVFIKNIPRGTSEDQLVPIFSKMGKIYELHLIMHDSGVNRGFAFLKYFKKAAAGRAVKKLNGYKIKPGHRIGVKESVDCRPKYERVGAADPGAGWSSASWACAVHKHDDDGMCITS